ncbi:hypothetical protein EYF80_026831 [Liparis tanakae]|uniref:Uncharacterized protein n=1 Tax=Liparis tanakae TaxID=230148 RepID=A0A4Z2HBE7_9TELE|nr:hypothetical protein EYF80_026831 [Liparis tanakae]
MGHALKHNQHLRSNRPAMLRGYSYLFSHEAFYSERSVGPLLPLLPGKPRGSRLAHTAGILPAQAKREAKSGGTDKISRAGAALHFCPLLSHIPWAEDKTPNDTKYSRSAEDTRLRNIGPMVVFLFYTFYVDARRLRGKKPTGLAESHLSQATLPSLASPVGQLTLLLPLGRGSRRNSAGPSRRPGRNDAPIHQMNSCGQEVVHDTIAFTLSMITSGPLEAQWVGGGG